MSTETVLNKENLLTNENQKITKSNWKTLWASFLGYTLDAMDWQMLSFIIPLIMVYWGVSSAQAGLVATVTMVGAAIGGWVIGILAEYYGRVKLLMVTILLYSIFTGLCAMSQDIYQLMFLRFLVGLGLGAEWGLAQTLVSESWPSKYRARASSFVHSGWTIGYGLAAVLFIFIGASWGWRGMFLIGVLPALLVVWVRRNVDESPLYLKLDADRKKARQSVLNANATEEEKKLTKFPLAYIFSKDMLRITIPVLIFFIGDFVTYWGVWTWVPTMLMKERGLSIAGTGGFMLVTTFAGFFGANLSGWLADRFGRKKTFVTFILATGVVLHYFVQVQSNGMLLVMSGLLGFILFGENVAKGTLCPELYPTFVRSTAVNFLSNIGRLVAGFAPFYIGYVAPRLGLAKTLGSFAFIYIIMAVMVILLPERKGVVLE